MVLRFTLLVIVIFTSNCYGQQNLQNPDVLYNSFTRAYENLSADALTSFYTQDGVVLNLYDNDKASSLKGREEIRSYYKSFFQPFAEKNQKLLLTFKITERRDVSGDILDNGVYRLEIVTPNKPSQFNYGKFSVVLSLESNTWKFKTDATTNTDFIEYESALSKPIPEREELLYPNFYDDLLGDYLTEEGEFIVIGRSQVRLFAFFENTNEFRGMEKINATTWSTGKTIKANEVSRIYKFLPDKLEIYENKKLVSTAHRKELYKNEKVEYKNASGIKLGGTLFIPGKPNGKAMVLVHGSGPQDRNGYASVIRLLADVFARNGITVLTYDKQGVGQSEGNSDYESFADLAQDALAGVKFLKSRTDLFITKTGLGGSSQAGWIIAKAIEQNSSAVDFVLTIGAAGSSITVAAQNLYNTATNMKCSGSFSAAQIEKAFTQQRYFFDYLIDQRNAKKLDDYTRSIAKDSLLSDWLFPTSKQIDLANRNQWFTALEVNFDPLPVWKSYTKPSLMLFSEFDDSTPAAVVQEKLDRLNNKNIQTALLPNAQHIGLETNSVCRNDFSQLNKFHDRFFPSMLQWLSSF